jgi:ligand-binding SRPBCC domain-containing protein
MQEKGPYRTWLHTHRFSRRGSAVIMEDHVDYALPFGVREGSVVCDPQVAPEPVEDRQPLSLTMFQLRNPANATHAA